MINALYWKWLGLWLRLGLGLGCDKMQRCCNGFCIVDIIAINYFFLGTIADDNGVYFVCTFHPFFVSGSVLAGPG